MALYKIGDTVTIRNDLKDLEGEIKFGLVREMIKLAGLSFVISEIEEHNYTPSKPSEDGCLYRLEGDTGHWSWSSEAFVNSNKVDKPFFKEGDRVTIRPDLEECESDEIQYGVNDEMANMAGMTCTIVKVTPDNYTITKADEDGCRYKIKEDAGQYSWSSEMFIINNLKTKQNENRLQKQEIAVSRGDKREGRTVCCRRSKIAVKRGHLSHKALTGN